MPGSKQDLRYRQKPLYLPILLTIFGPTLLSSSMPASRYDEHDPLRCEELDIFSSLADSRRVSRIYIPGTNNFFNIFIYIYYTRVYIPGTRYIICTLLWCGQFRQRVPFYLTPSCDNILDDNRSPKEDLSTGIETTLFVILRTAWSSCWCLNGPYIFLRPERSDIDQGSIYLSTYQYVSICIHLPLLPKRKGRLVFILMYNRSLCFRPELYDINKGVMYLSLCIYLPLWPYI